MDEMDKLAEDLVETFTDRDELAANIGEVLRQACRAAINTALEEAACEIEALERGTYTSARTPAGLVRAMKVLP